LAAMAAKFALEGLPVALVPVARYGLGGLLVLPWALRGARLGRLFTADWARLLIAAALCVPINQAFFLQGAKLAPTSHVGLIYAACPLVVLGLAALLGQEKLSTHRLIGVVASVAGVVILGLGNLTARTPAAQAVFLGDMLLIGAVVSWGAYLTVTKPLVTRHGSMPTLAATFLVGALLDVPFAIFGAHDWARLASAPAHSWWCLIYLSVVVTGIGLACQTQAMRRLEASQVATVGNLAPVLTVVWGVLLLGEPITPAFALGGVLTLAGILWTAHGVARTPSAAHRPGSVLVETSQAA
jgi:drug/metabolite transporter (DMT)-like permease